MNIDELNIFVPGQATPSDVGPFALLTTLVCLTTYPLIQSLGGGACYNPQVAPIASRYQINFAITKAVVNHCIIYQSLLFNTR